MLIDIFLGLAIVGLIVALELQTRRHQQQIDWLNDRLAHFQGIQDNTGLVCVVHCRSASRQQVPGGLYKWMPYCNYRVRHECEMRIAR